MRSVSTIAIVAALFFSADADAQNRRGGSSPEARAFDVGRAPPQVDAETAGAFYPGQADLNAMRARGFFATGLVPIYPGDASCPRMNSGFAATTRGDGSPRQRLFFIGYHGGIDIPVPEGTPVLAVAAGRVVHKSPGESIGGIGIVLQHAPTDTGLPVWTYTEYKHLREMPKTEIGVEVRAGEAIAISGKTGTTDGYYGPSGHPHLHLSVWYAATDAYEAGRVFLPADGRWMDPLALFRGPPFDSASLVALPAEGRSVSIPYVSAEGGIAPQGSKFVWPLGCAAKR